MTPREQILDHLLVKTNRMSARDAVVYTLDFMIGRGLGSKSINGHEMTLAVYHDQGGGDEELTLWCHTCDPTGKGLAYFIYDIRDGDIPAKLRQATDDAYVHASLAPVQRTA